MPTLIGKANFSVVGVQSIGSVGTVLVWSDVDESQSSNFGQTTSTQTPSWSDVNDSETPSWEEVA